MNIYEKINAITADLKKVAKNLEVGTGNNKYKAVKEGDILNAVKPLEEKYKVASYPCKRNVILQDVIETVNYKGEPKKNLLIRIETIYRFVNAENPEEYIETISYGDGVDSQDKAPGKAMTYADKYALMKAYKIETGDDPDAKASEELYIDKASPNQLDILKGYNIPEDWLKGKFNVAGIEELTSKQAQSIINAKRIKVKEETFTI